MVNFDVRDMASAAAFTAAAERSDWYSAALEMTALERGSPPVTPGAGWPEFAASVAGVNSNMLRKMQRAAAFVDQVTDLQLRERLKSRPLSHLEVLVRLHSLDPQAGDDLLSRYRASDMKLSYRELLSAYDAARDKASEPGLTARKTKGAAAAFVSTCAGIVSGDGMAGLYGAMACNRRRPVRVGRVRRTMPRAWTEAMLVSPAFFLFRDNRLGWDDPAQVGVDGVQAWHQHRSDNPVVAKRRMVEAATEATMLDVLWIFLPGGLPESYERHAEDLGLTNVGVIRVDQQGNPRPTRLPSAPPELDRRGLWEIWRKSATNAADDVADADGLAAPAGP